MDDNGGRTPNTNDTDPALGKPPHPNTGLAGRIARAFINTPVTPMLLIGALSGSWVGVWLFGGMSVASASEMTAADLQTLSQSTTGPGLLGDGRQGHPPHLLLQLVPRLAHG